jgi:hypothetical protein
MVLELKVTVLNVENVENDYSWGLEWGHPSSSIGPICIGGFENFRKYAYLWAILIWPIILATIFVCMQGYQNLHANILH